MAQPDSQTTLKERYSQQQQPLTSSQIAPVSPSLAPSPSSSLPPSAPTSMEQWLQSSQHNSQNMLQTPSPRQQQSLKFSQISSPTTQQTQKSSHGIEFSRKASSSPDPTKQTPQSTLLSVIIQQSLQTDIPLQATKSYHTSQSSSLSPQPMMSLQRWSEPTTASTTPWSSGQPTAQPMESLQLSTTGDLSNQQQTIHPQSQSLDTSAVTTSQPTASSVIPGNMPPLILFLSLLCKSN